MLANSYDRYAKLLNGTHKSHVHSAEEVFQYTFSLCVFSYYLRNEAYIWSFRLIFFQSTNLS